MAQNEQLAEELHKPIIRKFKKRRVYSAFKYSIWGSDLADMQLKRKPNKICVDKGSNSITILFKNRCKTMILPCIDYIMKENLLLLKDLLGY